jgi:hypothetical protein
MQKLLVLVVVLLSGCADDNARGSVSAQLIAFDGAVLELARRATGKYPLPGYVGPIGAVTAAVAVPNQFPVHDDWGHPILYLCTSDGQHHIVLSPGSDGRPDSALSWPYTTHPDVGLEDPRLDSVLVDGNIVRMQLSFNPGGPDWQQKSEDYLRQVIGDFSAHFERFPPNDPFRLFRRGQK